MSSWQVVQAVPFTTGGGNELQQYGQAERATQPDFYQKESYKDFQKEEEKEDMLPGQKLYYTQQLSSLNQQEQALRGTMYQYFLKGHNIPSASQQQEWNQALLKIQGQKAQLSAEASLYKQNYNRAKDYETKLIEGGDKSSANRIALTYDDGILMPLIGQKEEGGYGWMTDIEKVKGFDYMPGESPSGQPLHAGMDTPINYTGEWNSWVDSQFKDISKGKSITPQGDVSQKVSKLFGTDTQTWMTVITSSNNASEVKDAAYNAMEHITPTAKLDLASKFYEKLLFSKQDKDGTLFIPLDDPRLFKQFTKEESGVLSKLLNMQKLNRDDKNALDVMIRQFGQAEILQQVPQRTTVTESLRDLKVVDKGTGEGNVVFGGFTNIARGEAKPSGPAQIAYNEDNLQRSGAPGVFKDKSGQSLQLNRWEVPVQQTTEFNRTAKDALINQGGIMPNHFSGGFNFFYNQDGAPNSMAILEGSGARIIGLTGDVQENFIPIPKKGELDLVDVKKPPVDLARLKVKTIGVQLAVPSNSDFFSHLRKIEGLDITKGVDKGSYDEREYYDEYSGGKKAGKKPYRIVTVWMPVENETLYQFDNKEYAKGTQQAIEQENAKQQQEKSNYITSLRNAGLTQ